MMLEETENTQVSQDNLKQILTDIQINECGPTYMKHLEIENRVQ